MDLVTLIRSFNPHFLWCRCIPLRYGIPEDEFKADTISDVEIFIKWLEVRRALLGELCLYSTESDHGQKIPSFPAYILELWADYQFILVCDSFITEPHESRPSDQEIHAKSLAVLTQSQPLIRIFQTRHVLLTASLAVGWSPTLTQIAFVSDVHWDDVVMSLRQLRPLVPEDHVRPRRLNSLFVFMAQQPMSRLLPTDRSAVSRDIARAFIRAMKADLELAKDTWQVSIFLTLLH